MSHIAIRHPHSLGYQQARDSAQSVAEKLNAEYGLDYRWEGDSLHFKRTGIDGHIVVEEHQVLVNVKLGMLLRPMKPRLEEEIHRFLDQRFGQA